MALLVFIRWIVIYPVDSAIHRLNNWGLYFTEKSILKMAAKDFMAHALLPLIFESENKRLRILNYSDTCGRDLRGLRKRNVQKPNQTRTCGAY